jgi:3-oxoacyl-[acyl-carrier-protein] synthase-3
MSMREVYVNGTGSFYPNLPIANDGMEDVLGMVAGKPSWAKPIILDSCGIKQRFYALDPQTGRATHSNAEMTANAVKAAVASGGYDVTDVELLACGTATPDQLNPGHASMTHGELGGANLEVASFGGFCGSGMSALRYAYLSVGSGEKNVAAAAGSELSSGLGRASRFRLPQQDVSKEELIKDPVLSMNKEFLRWIAADGAAALLLSARPSSDRLSLRIDWLECESLANEFEVCMYQGGEKDRRTGQLKGWLQEPDLQHAIERNYFCITQDVALLKKHVIAAGINRVLKNIVVKRKLRAEDYDLFFPHLSSFFFKDRVRQGLKEIGFSIPEEKWYTNLDQVGNLGAAAMYSIIDQAYREGVIQPGHRILCGVPESGRFSYYFMQLTAVGPQRSPA